MSPVEQYRNDTLIDSHKPYLEPLNSSRSLETEQGRSNILTHSGTGLDAHRLSTPRAEQLEFLLDTTGFPTMSGPASQCQASPCTVRPVRASQCPDRARLGQARARYS